MTEFTSTVDGIPCIIKVSYFVDLPAKILDIPGNCYPAEFEFEFEVLDRKGRRAVWLERKLTLNDNERLAAEFIEHIEE